MINCLAVDDETPALDILEDNIRQVPFLRLVGKCKNAFAAMEVLQQQPVDLLFLDIEMPGISGLSLLKSLPGKPIVIFITAYRNYAVEGFDLDVLDYLVKPVAFDRFVRAANKALEYQGFKLKGAGSPEAAPDYLFIHTEYQLTKIFLNEIVYIEALRNYIRIHLTAAAKPILSKLSLKAIEERLPPARFTRVHKSFIVMLDKIDFVRNDIIRIGQRDIPLSRGCRDEFFRRINEIR
ncbi:MAG TPA: LytTR family DNA-binding domain-containing protein [Puia sp.]|jgi:DNA-binding LytR/AlgR family response regulator|nr:LytTR family DNA-binding domain-containing protein [Puia sp.]